MLFFFFREIPKLIEKIRFHGLLMTDFTAANIHSFEQVEHFIRSVCIMMSSIGKTLLKDGNYIHILSVFLTTVHKATDG